jgi:hypothetical protein
VAQPPPAVARTAITAEGGGATSSAASRVACAEAAGAVPAPALAGPLAALVTGHVLQDGELILLILKPSRWFVLLTTLRWAAVIGILLALAKIYDEQLPGQNAVYVEAGVFVLAGRVMWAVLQWVGRLYVLTDLRILKLSGVFAVDIFDCPLRKVARTRILYTVRERLFGLGSIEIVPSDEDYPIDQWQMVAKPIEVHRQIVETIRRAKQSGGRGS